MSHNVTQGVTSVTSKGHVIGHITYSLVGNMGKKVHRLTRICISR